MSLMEQSRPSGRSRRRFTKEFKADAVALARPKGWHEVSGSSWLDADNPR